ncbi:lysine transporter LysE [Acinetobacter sp. ANC 4558]|uniref:LysE family translocator n=1 Tax=Acinetobacter sp. ANC 4558 TaxID=1977876 RepID=UPI000A33B878|nr:LysE family transporter [Acinetobacter sp. ANC 4558]OTG86641.1 lysine transporter LysE [Acinetobacter sp. ANC 4558]
MYEFLAVALITILAVVSPGADFAVVTRNSYLYGRKIGIFTAFGIAVGVLLHVFYTLCAMIFIVSYLSYLLHIIKYCGAAYLIYIGYKTFMQLPIKETCPDGVLTILQAFKQGFLTNAFNPKTTLFVLSTYTQIVSIETPKFVLIVYGLFMSLAHFIWFSIVALVFSILLLRKKMLAQQVLMNRVIGLILCILGVLLVVLQINY